jgi:hypothetical protein
MKEGRTARVVPADAEVAAFHDLFGRAGLAVLVRPDGYAGLVSPLSRAGTDIPAYRRQWLEAPAPRGDAE